MEKIDLAKEFDAEALIKTEQETFDPNADWEIKDGRYYWKVNPVIELLHEAEAININKLWRFMAEQGIDKSDWRLRKFYRDLGYSLFGYWEIFYWEMNND